MFNFKSLHYARRSDNSQLKYLGLLIYFFLSKSFSLACSLLFPCKFNDDSVMVTMPLMLCCPLIFCQTIQIIYISLCQFLFFFIFINKLHAKTDFYYILYDCEVEINYNNKLLPFFLQNHTKCN